MGELLIVRGFIPQTNRRAEISGINSIGRRVASIAATLAITVGITGPLPTVRIDSGMANKQFSGVAHSGGGGECKIPGMQVILKEPKGVSVAECEPVVKKWYNAGFVYNDPNVTVR